MKYKRTKTADFWVLARRFLHDYMPVTRNLSDKSVEAYKQSLKVYLDFLELEQGISNEKVTFESSGVLEAMLDKVPSAKVIKQSGSTYTMQAEAYGKGLEMWLNSQGDKVKING